MKGAVLREFGTVPHAEAFPDPSPGDGETVVRMRAAGLSPITYAMAGGKHYASPRTLPAVLGSDGVGETADGHRVYGSIVRAPYGWLAEQVPVRMGRVFPVPDGIDDVTAAALPNPGLSSWLALEHRARIARNENVLILGATGTSGHLAIAIAKHLGAGRVVAVGRNPASLAELPGIGADAVVPFGTDETAFVESVTRENRDHPIDIVLDYLWGRPAELVLPIFTGREITEIVRPIRYVSIGSMASGNAAVSSAPLRSSGLTVMGSGIGSVPASVFAAAFPKLWALALQRPLPLRTEVVRLDDIDKAWARLRPGPPRFVVVP